MGEANITIQQAFSNAATTLKGVGSLDQVFGVLARALKPQQNQPTVIGAMQALHRDLGTALGIDPATKLAEFFNSRFKLASTLAELQTKGFVADDSRSPSIVVLKKLFAHPDSLNASTDNALKWNMRLVNFVGGFISRISSDIQATKFLETLREKSEKLKIIGNEVKQELGLKFLNEVLVPHYSYRCSYGDDYKFSLYVTRSGTWSQPEFQIGINNVEYRETAHKPFSVITPSLIKACPGLIDRIIERLRAIDPNLRLFTFVVN